MLSSPKSPPDTPTSTTLLSSRLHSPIPGEGLFPELSRTAQVHPAFSPSELAPQVTALSHAFSVPTKHGRNYLPLWCTLDQPPTHPAFRVFLALQLTCQCPR